MNELDSTCGLSDDELRNALKKRYALIMRKKELKVCQLQGMI